jgi:hypothetical protein
MYTCMYTCMYIYVYVGMSVCWYKYVYMYVYMYVHIRIQMYACMYVCMHACMYIYTYICMYVCNINTYIQTNKHRYLSTPLVVPVQLLQDLGILKIPDHLKEIHTPDSSLHHKLRYRHYLTHISTHCPRTHTALSSITSRSFRCAGARCKYGVLVH